MKQGLSKMLRSTLMLALSFAMAVGLVQPTYATNDDTEINYVSLGDSMTNGYGLPGYDGNTGVEDYGTGSYGNLFAEWLVDNDYATKVNHTKLGMSAMRAEDLHWLLELDYTDEEAISITDGEWSEEAWNSKFTTGDYWTWNELCDDYRLAVAAYAIENDGAIGKITDDEAAIVAEYFQESVKNADIISLGMGNGNFGVFMFGRIMEAIGFSGDAEDAMIYKVDNAIRELEPEMQTKVLELQDSLYANVKEYLGLDVTSDSTLEALANTVVYTAISYVLNYAGSVEAILQLNPNAEIILVGLMNTMEDNTEIEGISLGDLMEVVFTPLNAFIAALPTYMQATENSVYADATFYYAEAPKVECLVDVYGSEIEKGNDIIRDRFVQSIVVDEDGDAGMVWGLLDGVELVEGITLTNVSLDQINDYSAMEDADKVTYAADNTQEAVSIAVYLAFEKAIIASSSNPVTVDSVLGLGELNASLFSGVMTSFTENINQAIVTKIDAPAKFVASQSGNLLTADDIKQLVIGGEEAINEKAYELVALQTNQPVDNVKTGYDLGNPDVVAGVNSVRETLNGAVSTTTMLTMLLAIPETLSASLQNEPAVSGLLSLFARCVIGNGLGAHPSATGHQQLAAAIEETYANVYTAKDETIKNIKEAVEAVSALVVEYHDEAYAYAYDYAEQEGYIADAVATLNGLAEEVDGIHAWVELNKGNMSEEFYNELNSSIEEVKQTIVSLRELIENGDELDQETYDEAWELVEQLNQNLIDLTELVKIAGTDAGNAAWEQLVMLGNKVWAEWQNTEAWLNENLPIIAQKAVEYIAEKAKEGLQTLAEAIRDAVATYAPEVADAIYDYLYNNPEDVIGFVKEYGHILVDLAEEYGEEIVGVIGFLAVNYGDEVVEFLIENHEEILAAMAGWVDTHGENAWELIMVYAEELGLVDLVNGSIEDIQKALEAVKDIIEGQLEEIDGIILEAIQTAQKEIQDIIDGVVDGTIESLEDARDQIIAKLEALEEQIKDYVDGIYEGLYDQVEKLIDQAIEDINAVVESYIDGTIESVEDAIEAIETIVKQLSEDIEALINGILAQQTTADYTVSADSYYVSIGDDSAIGTDCEAYSQRLVDELGLTDAQFSDLAKAGFRAEDLRALLDSSYESDEYGEYILGKANVDVTDYIAEIAKADLITVNFGNNTAFVTAQVTKALSGYPLYELDWEKHVTVDGIQYVEELLAEIEAKILASGVSEEYAPLLMVAVESYIYSYVGFATNYPVVLGAIEEINPEATIILVGAYNPFEGMVFEIEGTEVDFGALFNDVINITDLAYLGGAFASENTIFVEAQEVTTILEDELATVITNPTLMTYAFAIKDNKLLASCEGHEYIKDQILNALNVTEDNLLLGDATVDGKVSLLDVQAIYEHVVGTKLLTDAKALKNADYNQDGRITLLDVQAVYELVIG